MEKDPVQKGQIDGLDQPMSCDEFKTLLDERLDVLGPKLDKRIAQAREMGEAVGASYNWDTGMTSEIKGKLKGLVLQNDIMRKLLVSHTPQTEKPDLIVELAEQIGVPREHADVLYEAISDSITEEEYEKRLDESLRNHPIFSKAQELSPEAVVVAKLFIMEEKN